MGGFGDFKVYKLKEPFLLLLLLLRKGQKDGNAMGAPVDPSAENPNPTNGDVQVSLSHSPSQSHILLLRCQCHFSALGGYVVEIHA